MSDPSAAPAYLFPPLPVPVLPIAGRAELFPIHRVYCLGQNYADHVRELGGDPAKQARPAFFQKAADCVAMSGATFPYPPSSKEVHYEIELVVALGRGGTNVGEDEARGLIYGYAAGFDMTCRDLQNEAKKSGRSWEAAKSFEVSAPCSAIMPAAEIGHPEAARIWLDVNGELRQDGNIDQMIWKSEQIIAYLSRFFTLRAGDLILTGTPAGVGPVAPGDHIRGGIDGVGELEIHVV
jgi:fumarylpyruvate hydrolase